MLGRSPARARPSARATTSISAAVVRRSRSRPASSREALDVAALVGAEPGRARRRPRSRARARACDVAGITRSTRASDSAHFRSACAHVSTPNGRQRRELLRRRSRVSRRPRRAASSRSPPRRVPPPAAGARCSHSRSRGLSTAAGRWRSGPFAAPPRALERGRVVVRDAEPADAPASRSSSSHGRCSRHATRLCTCSISTRPNQSSWFAELVLSLLERGCPDLRRHHGRSRRPSSAAPSERSAPPYIGDESKTRQPAPSAASTTSRASPRRASNVCHVPSPTTGPRRRSSISGVRPRDHVPAAKRGARRTTDPRPGRGPCARAGARRTPRANRRRRPPRAARASPAPRGPPARRRRRPPSAELEHRARVVRDAAVPIARVGLGDANREDRRAAERCAPRSRPRPPRRLRARAASRCRRSRAPARRRPRRTPAAQPRRAPTATPTHCDLSVDAGADATPPPEARVPAASRTVSDSDTGQRAAGELDVRDTRPRRSRRTPARPGCGASSRRPACRRASRASRPALLGVPTAACSGVYGSAITCAPGSGSRSSPRVRLA